MVCGMLWKKFIIKGLVKALGVSNMYADQLMDFMMHVRVKPVIN